MYGWGQNEELLGRAIKGRRDRVLVVTKFGQVRSLKIAGGRATGDRAVGLTVPSLSSFGEDARGRVYATSLNGPVYRLVSSP